jgi:hypothetical protein
LHDCGDRFAKAAANILDSPDSTSVFRRIVKQRADGFILSRTVFQRDAGHAKQMSEIGNHRGFTGLACMNQGGIV